MKVHLVGGFTGSGKSIAIANARKLLAERNISSFVFSDKEEEYFLADCPKSTFGDHPDFGDSPLSGAPYARVTGGCFCCNYTQLDSQIELLKKKSTPSELFAEYGGTCTNLISTLLKPLRDYKNAEIELANFSTFIEAKFLLLHLKGLRVPLSAESKYSWDKHLEEAEILVINKTDLLSSEDLEELERLAKEALGTKQLLFQNSLVIESIRKWVDLISLSPLPSPKEKKTVDQQNGNIAWLDEEIQIVTQDNSALKVAYEFMQKLSKDLVQRDLPIEHLKFLLYGSEQPLKLNHTVFLNDFIIPVVEKSNSADLMINARVQTSHQVLRQYLFDILDHFKTRDGVQIVEKFISYF